MTDIDSHPDPLRIARTIASVAAFGLLAGCGNLTAGGFGEARVAANGDAPDAPVAAVLGAPARADGLEEGEEDVEPVGELELAFRLYLESEQGGPVALSRDELHVSLDLEGSLQPDVVSTRVPADTYRALRIVFSEIEVEVEDGVVIDGQEVYGEVEIDIESLEVERSVSLTVLDGSTVEILLDLNAATWLGLVDPGTKTVRPTDFADAFTVRIR